MKNLTEWLKTGEYLPDFMRDFHDQKDLFKAIHSAYRNDDPAGRMPSWVTSHIYVVDWFLWFMASRGYTLQKCRKKDIEWRALP